MASKGLRKVVLKGQGFSVNFRDAFEMMAPFRNPEIYVLFAGILYGFLAFSLSNAPIQDLPNHLVRAHILSDLLFNHGEIFGAMFVFKPMFAPYLAGDLLLAILDKWFGTQWACRLWLATVVLSLPVATWFVLITQQVSRLTALAGALLAFYVGTDWFFTMGFLNYKLATSIALFAYGWFLRARETTDVLPFIYYIALVVIAYAMHLSALIFIIAIVGMSVGMEFLRGEIAFARAARLLSVPCILLAVHFALEQHDSGVYVSRWGSWAIKILRLGSSFIRFDRKLELELFGVFLIASLLPLAIAKPGHSRRRLELLILAAVFIGLYFVMPRDSRGVIDIDDRALPYALLFFIFAGANAATSSQALSRVQFAIAATVACLNLAFLCSQMLPQDQAMSRYKMIAGIIPKGSKVLPINTRHPIGRYQPFIHAGSYATLESEVITPYLFAGNWTPTQSYFLYRSRPDAPSEFWYTVSSDASVVTDQPDWALVQRDYDYLLVTIPWDQARIPVKYRRVAGNEVVELLSIRN